DTAEGNGGTLAINMSVSTVTVKGAGDLTFLRGDYKNLTSFDAHSASGSIRLGVDTPAGQQGASIGLGENFSIISGSGDDVFVLSNVETTGTIDLGEG